MLLALETNVLRAGNEHFSAGDESVENTFQTSATHTASYQRLPNRTYVKMVASHSCSLPKTGDSYHAADIQKLTRGTTVSSVALILVISLYASSCNNYASLFLLFLN